MSAKVHPDPEQNLQTTATVTSAEGKADETAQPVVNTEQQSSAIASTIGKIDATEAEEEDQLRAMSVIAERLKLQVEHDKNAQRLQSQQRRRPIFVTASDEQEDVDHKHGGGSWQSRLLHCIHGHKFQTLLITLLLADVVVVVVELFVEAHYPTCNIIKRDAVSCIPEDCAPNATHHRLLMELDKGPWGEEAFPVLSESIADLPLRQLGGRLLAGDSHGDGHELQCKDPHHVTLTDAIAACDDHKYPALHTAHYCLVSVSVGILVFFFVELMALLVCLGCSFFRNFLYVADLFIVSASLALEFVLFQTAGGQLAGLLLFARFWRFVRIAHGMATSVHEHGHHKMAEVEEALEELLENVAHLQASNAKLEQQITSLSLSPAGKDKDICPIEAEPGQAPEIS